MSVSATAILAKLRDHDLRVFTTSDLITLFSLNKSAASQALKRLERAQLVTKIRRGLWANRLLSDLHPYEAVSPLTAPWPSYVSLQSALAEHGLIAEIPSIHYAVTSGRGGRFQTGLGTYHIHHLPAPFIWGYALHTVGQGHYLLAEPEKAVLDMAYLALVPRTGLRFPPTRPGRRRLDRSKLLAYLRRLNHPGVRALLKNLHWL